MISLKHRVESKVKQLKEDQELFEISYTGQDIAREFGSLLIQTIMDSPDPQTTAWLLLITHPKIAPFWEAFKDQLTQETISVPVIGSMLLGTDEQ